jgi:hypothetical protein
MHIFDPDLKKIEYADLPGSYFEENEEGYQNGVDSIYQKNSKNAYLMTTIGFCEDPLYAISLKKEIYNRYFQKRMKTYTFIKYLSKYNPDAKITLIPVDTERLTLYISETHEKGGAQYSIPQCIHIWNRILVSIKNCLCPVIYPVFLVFISGKLLLRGLDCKPEQKKFDFAFDIFNSGINIKNLYEFFFIFDFKRIHPEQTLQVIRNAFQKPDAAQKTEHFFSSHKYPYIQFDQIKIPVKLFVSLILVKFIFSNCLSLLRNLSSKQWKYYFLIPSLAVMKMKIEAEIFYQQYDVKVFIARDEYSPFHIVRTLVARSHGNATIGFSHGDDCHHTAALNYLIFDRYVLWGTYYRNHLAKSLKYSRTDIIGAGIYGLDKTYQWQSKAYIPSRYRSIREKFKIAGIFGSSFSPDIYITKELTIKFYKTVLDQTDRYENCYRIIKPKGNEFDDPELKEIILNHKNVVLEDSLWTYRLLTALDILICINVSTVGLEGLIAGKKVFYFDVTNNKDHHVYSSYDNQLVAFDEKTLQRNLEDYFIRGIYTKKEIIDTIIADHGYQFDGMVGERMRKNCMELLKKA